MIHPLRNAYLLYGWFVVFHQPLYPNLRFHEQEYEEQTTPEARFVKGRQDLVVNEYSLTWYVDLDRIEMALQGGPIVPVGWNRKVT
jgi:hypothetical protein